jgi:YidC/Oxa1 family membrane protein insertase
MQDKDKMHPQDKRNLIIFGVLSLLLWLSYDHFILQPKMEKMRAAQEVQEQKVKAELATGNIPEIVAEAPRDEVLQNTKTDRIELKNDLIFGSVNLTGARIDDVALTNHFKTIEREENAVVLSPTGTPHPKYVEQGWVASDASIQLPNSQTKWQKIAGDILSPNNPVTLAWDNGQGLRFEKVISVNDDYKFTIIDRVINNSSQNVTLFPYGLVAQRGVPEEFLGRWIVHEGPIAYFGDELVEETYGKMSKNPVIQQNANEGWVALTSKNWLTAVLPPQGQDTKFRISYTGAKTQNAKDRYQADMTGLAVTAPAGGMAESEISYFIGAKKLNLLSKYEKELNIPHLDLAVDFGLFYFLTRPFFAVINFFYGLVGNFGIAIILFTVILRIAVFPLANTSFKSFAKMRQIAPKMHELREQHGDNKQKLQQELVKLYQREKVNPMAGCLPILIQIPIFFALFKVLSNTIEMRHAPFFGWIQDLSAPDPTSIFNLFGLLPFTPPGFLMIGIWPCLMLVTMIIQRKLSPPPTDKLQAQMIATMPWVMTFVLAQFAAGLVIYWTFNNLFSTIQQYIIMRRMGVDVDLIGNILGKKKEPTPIEGVHAETAKLEEDIEDALGVDQKDTPENAVKKSTKKSKKKSVSKPKPKKKTKKKK